MRISDWSSDVCSSDLRGVRPQRAHHIVGMDLEPAADDRIVGAAADEQEMVGIEDRAIGGSQPPKPVAELFALEFEQPFITGGQRRTRGGDDSQRRVSTMNPGTRPAVIGRFTDIGRQTGRVDSGQTEYCVFVVATSENNI